jgi:hypothetical protein
MKAKYKHYGNECIIYDQVICEDNMVITIRSYISCWFNNEPETETTMCSTNEEAKKLFNKICKKYEKEKYDCEYQED